MRQLHIFQKGDIMKKSKLWIIVLISSGIVLAAVLTVLIVHLVGGEGKQPTGEPDTTVSETVTVTDPETTKDPVVTDSGVEESTSDETRPVDTDPVDTKETEPNEPDTVPAVTDPIETEPVETEPAETETVHTHAWGDWQTTKEATCTETGVKERICDCGEAEQEIIEATGHTEVTDAASAPTCTGVGLTEGKHCSVCSTVLIIQNEIPATGHSFGEWYETKAPTETVEGEKRRDCAHCDEYETTPIAALDHDHNNWDTVTIKAVAPTCTATGLTEGKKCAGCGETLVAQEVVPATGHSMGGWKQTMAPTCTASGAEKRECANCDYEETRNIAATGHNHTAGVTQPTCTKQGYTTYTCSCGDSYISNTQFATGHNYSAWKAVVKATCEAGGQEERTCGSCGDKQTRELSAVGHQYELTQASDGESVYRCEVCLQVLDISDGNAIPEEWEDRHVVPLCDESFSFRVISVQGEAYIYNNLSIVDTSYLESLAALPVARIGARNGGTDGLISYTVTPVADAPHTWLVTATGGYAPYNTYVAHTSGDLAFADYNTDTLVFGVEGPDRANIQFNEDNILFLKALEAASPGYYPYTIRCDENAECYNVTVGKDDAFDDSCIGLVLCVGDYANCDQILADSSRELYFGKIESVRKDESGRTVLELSVPELGDIYDLIEYSGSSGADLSALESSDELKREIRMAFMNSDGFVQMVTAANLAASSYAAEYGYDTYTMSRKSVMDSIKMDVDVKKSDSSGVVASITATLEIDLKVSGKKIGKISVTCKAELNAAIDVHADMSTKSNRKKVDFKNFNITITNTNTISFDFECKVVMDYSAETPAFVVNKKTGKIHTTACRYYVNAQNKGNYDGYSVETLLHEYDVDSLEKLKDKECSVCKAISKLCRTSFAVNVNTGKVHCMNCIYVKEESKNLEFWNTLPPASYSYCKSCKPQNLTLDDFETHLHNSLDSENWASTIEKVKTYMKDASDPSENGVGKTIVSIPINLTVITVNISVDFVLDFDLEASLKYHNEKVWTNEIYVIRTEGELYYGTNPIPNESSRESLDMVGTMKFKIGGAVRANVGFTGLVRFCYIGVSAEAGLYAEARGVLHASTKDGESDTGYYAAYFEAGVYAGVDINMNILWWTKDISLYEEKRPFVICGHDRAYYQFSEYDREIEITGGKVSIDSLDILKVDYLYLPSMSQKNEELSPTGKSGRYTVSYQFLNPDGSENTYVSVQNGYIVVSDSALGDFEVTMIVTVQGDKDAVTSFSGLKALTGEMGWAFFLEPYEVTLYISGEASEGLAFTSNGDGTCYVSGIGTCTDTDIIIPSMYKGERVIGIGDSAFIGCTNLTAVTIPDSVIYIDRDSFRDCINLKDLNIPTSVTAIGYEAFHSCLGLLVNENGVYYVDNWAVASDPSLEEAVLRDGTIGIADGAIFNRAKITSIVIPGSVDYIGVEAFGNCKKLRSVIISDGVSSIGNFAFRGCTSLTSITVYSKTVLSNDGAALELCDALNAVYVPAELVDTYKNTYCWRNFKDRIVAIPVTQNIGLAYEFNSNSGTCTIMGIGTCTDSNIIIPEYIDGYRVTQIGESAFFKCSSISSITIPASVTSIGNKAFLWCTNLEHVEFDNNSQLTSIGNQAFDECEKLISIQLPVGLNRIGNNAFYGCTSLESVTIPEGVTIIGQGSYWNCTGLTSVAISDSVTSIGTDAFSGCDSLASVLFGENSQLDTIGPAAFRACRGLTSITIPDSVTAIGSRAFDYCPNLKTVYYKGTLEQWCSIVFAGSRSNPCSNDAALYIQGELVKDLVIPAIVTRIGDYAFWHVTNLTSITFEEGSRLTTIGCGAFDGCLNLENIVIPAGVTTIGDGAFRDCTGLIETIGGIQYVDNWIIGCSISATNVVFCENTRGIASFVFKGCTSLESITIPNSVICINRGAFYGCTSLTSVTFEAGSQLTTIGINAFWGCDSLVSITIPDRVTTIGAGAFVRCTSLTSVVISDSVTYIGESAFSGCTSLTSIEIPDSVTSIDYDAFSGCTGLTSIDIPDSVTSIGNSAFYECTGLTSIKIPDSVTSIYSNAFSGCTGLTSVTLGNGVTRIYDEVFYKCTGLTSITILDSVTSIGKAAFYGCRSLTSMTFEGTVDQWNAITKGTNWNNNVPATEVICSDGVVPLN